MQCFLAGVLILSQIISFFQCNRGTAYQDLLSVLDNKQMSVLEKVSNERLRLYLSGQGIGLVLGLLLLYFFRCSKQQTGKLCMTGCAVVIIIYLTTYLYYQLSPKSDYLIKYLDKPVQRQAWMNMCVHMRTCHIIGLVFGFIGYYLLATNVNLFRI